MIVYKTKKLLFLGVRNEYCAICVCTKADQTSRCTYNYTKNWPLSSGLSCVEPLITVDGFIQSEKMCSIRYHKEK